MMPGKPEFDAAFYQTRASRYAMLARLEPEPSIRSALDEVVRSCRERAAALIMDSDIAWKD